MEKKTHQQGGGGRGALKYQMDTHCQTNGSGPCLHGTQDEVGTTKHNWSAQCQYKSDITDLYKLGLFIKYILNTSYSDD